jgi:hypothetical protein
MTSKQVVPEGSFELEGAVNSLPDGELLTENDISVGQRVQHQSESRTGIVKGFIQTNGAGEGETAGVPKAHALIQWDVGKKGNGKLIQEPQMLYPLFAFVGICLTILVIAVVVALGEKD